MDEKDLVMQFIETLEGLRRYRRWYRDHSIPIRKNEMMLLMFLVYHLPDDALGGLQPSELGKMLRLTRPTITALVNSLEEQRYVVRINDEEDRRVVFVRPTEQGAQLVNRAQESFATNIAELVQFLGEKMLKSCSALWVKLGSSWIIAKLIKIGVRKNVETEKACETVFTIRVGSYAIGISRSDDNFKTARSNERNR